ncbi:putative polyketide biosynthesis enoyl-CoA hydratase PksH (plasmid) [Streptomyces sp. YIM 121038]|uniref:enoyl-CoA hydratase-related protein n=1 Tax=Streptomyces sp. YIM 121038 TaxID=2136401 RepID=UPI001110B463|nr:enoyl-CoA hydratase-related protein [Streptomyces sp. YIM 121038]QCX82551.1 putative polyketide biosynthesis enoyl-CoA hydratase PksH [Streptomyces sp. YIM 121038]
MTEAQTVVLEPGTGYLRVRLGNGNNPLDNQLVCPLLGSLDTVEADRDCLAVVIHSDGPVFCSGMPLRADAELPAGWADAAQPPPWQLFQRLAHAPVVTVAVVDGEASGGGVALAAACDLVVVGPAARFRLTELLLGLVPAMAMPFIARRTGPQAARRLALTCAEIGPSEAVRIGLADFTADDPTPFVRHLLVSLSRLDRDAVGVLKSYLRIALPTPSGLAEAARDVLVQRIGAPSVAERLRRLHTDGLLR